MKKTIELEKQVFLKSITQKIKRNQNAIIVFNGGTGSGKSYACLDLANDLAKHFQTPFNVQDNMDFNFKKLLKKMQLKKNIKPGTIFLLEEVGAFGSGAASREWQSQANKFFHSFLQTSRHKNQIFIMNCPSFNYLEKGCRELVHYQLEAICINKKIRKSMFKPYKLQVNTRTGKIYFKFIRYTHKNNPYVKTRLKRINFSLPPKNMIREYETLKLAYTTKLNNSILEDKPDKRENMRLKYEQRHKNMIQRLINKGLKNPELVEVTGLNERTIRRYRKEFRENGKTENSLIGRTTHAK